MKKKLGFLAAFGVLVLSGCATMPTGPTVMVMPPQGKSFEQFQHDDAVCRQWAAQRIGTAPQAAADQSTARGAVAGAAIGAGVGAAIGAATGTAASGAAIGAASGLFLGTAAGASEGQAYGWRAQRDYDISYSQCMYSKGNEVQGMRHRERYAPPPPDLSNRPPDARY